MALGAAGLTVMHFCGAPVTLDEANAAQARICCEVRRSETQRLRLTSIAATAIMFTVQRACMLVAWVWLLHDLCMIFVILLLFVLTFACKCRTQWHDLNTAVLHWNLLVSVFCIQGHLTENNHQFLQIYFPLNLIVSSLNALFLFLADNSRWCLGSGAQIHTQLARSLTNKYTRLPNSVSASYLIKSRFIFYYPY